MILHPQEFEKLNLLSIKTIQKFCYITNFNDLEYEVQKLSNFSIRNLSITSELVTKFPSEGHSLMDILPAFDIGFHTIIINFRSDKAYIDEKSKLSEEDWTKFKHFIFNHNILQQLSIVIFREAENLLPSGTININLNYRDIAERKLDAFYACESYEDYEKFLLKYLKIPV